MSTPQPKNRREVNEVRQIVSKAFGSVLEDAIDEFTEVLRVVFAPEVTGEQADRLESLRINERIQGRKLHAGATGDGYYHCDAVDIAVLQDSQRFAIFFTLENSKGGIQREGVQEYILRRSWRTDIVRVVGTNIVMRRTRRERRIVLAKVQRVLLDLGLSDDCAEPRTAYNNSCRRLALVVPGILKAFGVARGVHPAKLLNYVELPNKIDRD